MRMLIVDDHPLFRSGVRNALAETGDWEEIVEVGSLAEAEAALDGGAFSLVLLDLGLPDGSGLELLERRAQVAGAPSILVLSMNADRAIARRAMRLGAAGYASKGIDLKALILGVRLVASGGLYVEGEILRDLLAAQAEEPKDRNESRALIEALSPRERETLEGFLDGLSTKEMAVRHEVSQRTIENYQSAVYTKLGAKSPVDLVRISYRAGIFDPS